MDRGHDHVIVDSLSLTSYPERRMSDGTQILWQIESEIL
jgi:hypothetical protein